jgi:adenosylcobyric acid synthase
MLGHDIDDPDGLEGAKGSAPGLGLLNVSTTLLPDKNLTRVEGIHAASGEMLTGYEIHLGATQGPDCARPFARVGDRPDGAVSPNGRIMGTYLHGCFASNGFRHAFLQQMGGAASGLDFEQEVESALDQLAQHLERHLDIERLLGFAEPVRT